MAASVRQPKFKEAHGRGPRACILWDIQGKVLVTAGADMRLLIHAPDAEPVAAAVQHQKAVTALALAPAGHLLASASLDHAVKLYEYPGATFQNNVTRFTLPIRSLAFSITGGLLAAAGDDEGIKLISTVDHSIVRVMKGHAASVVSLAFDPKNDILASIDTDGTVIYWSIASGSKLHTLQHAAPDVDVEDASRNEIAWHPSGDVLAVPGHQFDVVMYDRDTAEVRFRLRGGHNTAVGFLSWSPNGKYLATTGQDRKVMVWDIEKKIDLDRLKVLSQVSCLAWKPTGNALALIDADGKFCVWEDPIPSHLASPSDLEQSLAALTRQDLLHFSDNDNSDNEGSGGSGSTEKSGEDNPMDFDSDEEEVKVKVKKELKDLGQSKLASRKVSQATVVSAKLSETTDSKIEPRVHAPRPQKQTAFQPGSTSQSSGSRRFLAYNLLGCITSSETAGVSHVEVEFHDTSRGHRVAPLSDYFGFTMAALCSKGSIYANPQRGEKTPSTLVYRPFTSWASNSEWSMRFPTNEEVKAVAVGDGWAAAATSLNYLRIFGETGQQKYLLSLAGAVVAMTSQNQLLAVLTHASDPSEAGEQVMEFVVLDMFKKQRLLSGPIPLTPGAKLAWLGFSEAGALSTFDSQGVLRVFSKAFGACWVPVYSVPADQQSSGETTWLVGLNDTQIFCIKCKAPDIQPQVNPKPVLSILNFSMPLVHSDLGAADLENELSCKSFLLGEARAKADEAAFRGEDDDDYEEQISRTEAELDRCLLRLISAACHGDKLARALDLASMLSLHRSLEGAIKLVTAMRLPSLAERLNTMLEGRRDQEKIAATNGRETNDVRVTYPSTILENSLQPLKPPVFSLKSARPATELSNRPPDLIRSSVPLVKARAEIIVNSEGNALPSRSPQKQQVKDVDAVVSQEYHRVETESEHKLSNPFAKPINPFAKSSAPEADVSVLATLSKMQKSSVEGEGKRKADGGNTRPPQRPAKGNRKSS